jgi:ribonuclease BN (tRNA processing enzyme)
MIIRFLGAHNEESRETRWPSLLIDDVLAVDAGSLVSELSFAEQEKVTAVLLSHGHYDHISAVPALVFNNSHRLTRVYAAPETLNILTSHLLDGIIYPEFAEDTSFLGKQALELCPLEHLKATEIDGKRILPLAVNHFVGAMGFEITSRDGKSLFYTGDAGPGISQLWPHINPQVLITDLTFPNSRAEVAAVSKHLCPRTLQQELIEFRQMKGYLPQVILFHMSPRLEAEIREEIAQVAEELSVSIELAHEGKVLSI